MEKTNRHHSALFNFFNSPIPIFIALGIIIVVLLVYIKSLYSSVTLYTFGGYNDDITFLNGTIYIGRDINHFGDSKIKYDGKDITLYDFEIGYFIGDFKLASIEAEDELKEKGASLKTILENNDFSFTESHIDSKFFSEENIANLDKFVFKIKGKDKKGKEISIEVPLNVNKITK